MKLTSLFFYAPIVALVAACSAAPTETAPTEPTANEGEALTPPPADLPEIDGPVFRDPCRPINGVKRCLDGWHCTAPADRPYCVRDTPTNPCATVLCPPLERCVVRNNLPVCTPLTY